MGLTLGKIFYLEELSADCAADGRWGLPGGSAAAGYDRRGHANQPLGMK